MQESSGHKLTTGVITGFMGLIGGSSTINLRIDKSATTASYSLDSNEVVLPELSLDADREIVLSFAAHESFHCRWTTNYAQAIRHAVEEVGAPQLGGFISDAMNILEDVRIESRGMKEFSGARRLLAKGYKKIWESDHVWGDSTVVEFAETPMYTFSRINYHWKATQWVHAARGVKITKYEQELIDRASAAEETSDVCDIVIEAVKKIIEEIRNEEAEEPTDDDAPEHTNSDFWGDATDLITEDEDEDEDEDSNRNKKFAPEDLENHMLYYRGAWKQWPEFNKGKRRSQYEHQAPLYIFSDDLSYGYAHREFRNMAGPITKNKANRRRLDQAKKIQRSMERKKFAAQDERTRVWESGELDPSLLHLAGISDDVFLTNQTEHNTANYGVVFMLDCSGSMGGTFTARSQIKDSLQKLAVLAAFCKLTGIKFEIHTWGHRATGVLCTDETFSTPALFSGFLGGFLSKKKNTNTHLMMGGTDGCNLVQRTCSALYDWESRKGVALNNTSVMIMTDGSISSDVFQGFVDSTPEPGHWKKRYNVSVQDARGGWWRAGHESDKSTWNLPQTISHIVKTATAVKSHYPQVNIMGIFEGQAATNFRFEYKVGSHADLSNQDVIATCVNTRITCADEDSVKHDINMQAVTFAPDIALDSLVSFTYNEAALTDATQVRALNNQRFDASVTEAYTELLTDFISKKF